MVWSLTDWTFSSAADHHVCDLDRVNQIWGHGVSQIFLVLGKVLSTDRTVFEKQILYTFIYNHNNNVTVVQNILIKHGKCCSLFCFFINFLYSFHGYDLNWFRYGWRWWGHRTVTPPRKHSLVQVQKHSILRFQLSIKYTFHMAMGPWKENETTFESFWIVLSENLSRWVSGPTICEV